jgi:hypothetical protein
MSLPIFKESYRKGVPAKKIGRKWRGEKKNSSYGLILPPIQVQSVTEAA